jgi:hypothetical protein
MEVHHWFQHDSTNAWASVTHNYATNRILTLEGKWHKETVLLTSFQEVILAAQIFTQGQDTTQLNLERDDGGPGIKMLKLV